MTEPRLLNIKFRFDTGEQVLGVSIDISEVLQNSISEDHLIAIAAAELRKFLHYIKEKQNVRRDT